MKKFLVMIMLFILILPATQYAVTQVQLNGQIIDFTDENGRKVDAQIINNRTMVPLRKIFELLGCDVTWDGDTQLITATKEDTTIELQINRMMAKKTEAGVTKEIILDSAPVIVDDRTLVPLRFIAESLNKQVGWDANEATAIIIDYTYFENQLKQKAPALYYFLVDGVQNSHGVLTRKFADKETKDNSIIDFTINEDKSGDKIKQNLKINFSGDNDLMQDIIKEKWNEASAEILYGKTDFTYTSTGTFQNVLNTIENNNYNGLGNSQASFEDLVRLLINLDENEITTQSFSNIKTEFDKLCDLFDSTNTSEKVENGTQYTWNFNTKSLNYQNAFMKYFDLTKLDNILFNHAYSRTYNFLNQKIFQYDVNQDELFYDTSSINLNGKISVVENAGKIINYKLELYYESNNIYEENISYSIIAESI